VDANVVLFGTRCVWNQNGYTPAIAANAKRNLEVRLG